MGERNWSERVEELLEEGDRHGAIELLQNVVEKMESEPGAQSNLSLAVAMGDLAALYDQEGMSIKADSLRSSSIVIKHRAQHGVWEPPSAEAPEEKPADAPPNVQEDVEEDWEKAEYDLPTSSSPMPTSVSVSKLSLEEKSPKSLEDKTPKQRGRGAFTYGNSGFYSDHRNCGRATIEKFAKEDDSFDQPSSTVEDSCNYALYGASHVLVLEGFPPKTTTTDLEEFVRPFASRGVIIRWVNDTTALAVFRNPTVARDALGTLKHPLYKLKPYDESTELHGLVSEKDLEPPAPRPVTSARAAQRMIVGALAKQGLVRNKVQTRFTAEELQKQEDERKQRLLAREKLKEEAWGGD